MGHAPNRSIIFHSVAQQGHPFSFWDETLFSFREKKKGSPRMRFELMIPLRRTGSQGPRVKPCSATSAYVMNLNAEMCDDSRITSA